MNNTRLSKCNFCKYHTKSGCMSTPNSYYCKEANNEYYQYLRDKKSVQFNQKILRPWDKKY